MLAQLRNISGSDITYGSITFPNGVDVDILNDTLVNYDVKEIFESFASSFNSDVFNDNFEYYQDSVLSTKEDLYVVWNQVYQYLTSTFTDEITSQEGLTMVDEVKHGTLNYKRTTLIYQSSYVTQEPTTTDTLFAPNYGNVSDIVTDDLTLASNGELTVNNEGQYYIRLFGHFGRLTTSGTSKCIFWGQIDVGGGWVNIPNSQSKVFMISNANDIENFEYEFFFQLPAGVKLRYVFVRDSSGTNDGGLYTFNPNYGGAQPFPSLGVDLSKIVKA